MVAVDLTESAMAGLADTPHRDSIRSVAADVSSSADVQRYVEFAVDAFGGIDILFNNAGIEVPSLGSRPIPRTCSARCWT